MTKQANFRRKPLFQATKQHLNGEKGDAGHLSDFAVRRFCCGVLVSSVWKKLDIKYNTISCLMNCII